MEKKTFGILATLLFVALGAWSQGTETPTWSGSGTSDDPYLIQSVADWNKLAEGSKTNTYEGVYFRQTFTNETTWQDATQMVGSNQDYPFAGIYDGGGYRLDFKHLDETVSTVAPFRYIKNATIKHLYLFCSDVRGGNHVSGLVGATVGDGNTPANTPTNIIEDCRVGGLISNYGTQAGGFIGHGGGANNILRGCLFDGTIDSEYSVSATEQPKPTYAAPFIGWCEYTTDDRSTLQGCFEKGKYEGFTNTALYFVNGTDKTKGVVVDRTYHNQEWDDGCHAYTVASGTKGMTIRYIFEVLAEDPAHSYFTCKDYSTSGIKFYAGDSHNAVGLVVYDVDKKNDGQTVDDVLYLKAGEVVPFYVTSPYDNCSFPNIVADNGTLEKNGQVYDLTMTTANSVITGNPYVILGDESLFDNSAILNNTNGMTGVTVKLYNRTLTRRGRWNTLCLPFAIDNFEGTPLEGATVKTLESASFSNGTLTLNFSENGLTAIKAGKPYIVKWDDTESTEQTDITNPEFSGVTINNKITNVETEVVTFSGIFSPYSIEGEDRTLLYLGGDNKLYYPNDEMTIGSCRAYFKLEDGLTAGEPTTAGAKGINNFVLNFNDDETTGITTTNYTNSTNSCDAWYSIDGRRLAGKPTQEGVYINNGKQIVIK